MIILCGNAHHGTIGRDIFENDGIGTDDRIVANVNRAQYFGTRTDGHIVADDGRPVTDVFIPDHNMLIDIAVGTDALGGQPVNPTVFNEQAGADTFDRIEKIVRFWRVEALCRANKSNDLQPGFVFSDGNRTGCDIRAGVGSA